MGCNFTPSVHHDDRIGMPKAGPYRECINTGSEHDGGSNSGAPFGEISAEPAWLGKPFSLHVSILPLATVILTWPG